MNIVIAPDSYKESLTAQAVASHIEAGFREIFPEANYICLPLADGGEGTVSAMLAATQGEEVSVNVSGPLGETITASFGLINQGKTAVIEMAQASGLELLSVAQRNPMLTTSYGTGELILSALEHNVSHCIIGIGGSATNDGGAGMLQALGVRLLDKEDKPIGKGGEALSSLVRIDMSQLDPRIKNCRFDIACDVTNPLTGENGASAIFGPQKGATAKMIAVLDKNLTHFAAVIRQDIGVDVEYQPGAGAAGGMGAALLGFLQANLKPGLELVAETVALEDAIKHADLVITGEGRLDGQSINGKVPVGVATIARRHKKPVLALAGSLHQDADRTFDYGIDAAFSTLQQVCTLEQAFADAGENVRKTARNIAAALKMGMVLQKSQ